MRCCSPSGCMSRNHRLILMNPDGSNEEQLIPDDRHTGTLEYFDW